MSASNVLLSDGLRYHHMLIEWRAYTIILSLIQHNTQLLSSSHNANGI